MFKRINKKRIIKIIAFIVFMAVVLFVMGRIVCAKFIGDSTTIVDGFYSEKKNDIDMIVIGSSNSFCTIDPVALYDEYGIASYDFGSSSQPMNISSFYLKEALKRQNPKVVALEINMMIGDSINGENEAGLRWGYTDMPFSVNKLKSIYESTGKIDAEYFSYVFPVFRYHNRWKELSKTDYTYFYQDKTNYTKGYLETQSVAETEVNLSGYDSEGEAWIDERNIAYLDEMTDICRKKGVELLLFKSPRENWHRYETEAIKQLAQERNLKFVDYNEIYSDGKIELDTGHDFRDSQHLNDFGAKKVTSDFGKYLKNNYNLPDRRTQDTANSWDKASIYRKRKGQQEYMTAVNAYECLKLLQTDSNYIIMAVKRDTGANSVLEQWVYENSDVVFHKVWNEDGIEHIKIGKSKLVMSRMGPLYQVLIDGIEHYQEGYLWNIIVYDKVTKDIKTMVFDE